MVTPQLSHSGGDDVIPPYGRPQSLQGSLMNYSVEREEVEKFSPCQKLRAQL